MKQKYKLTYGQIAAVTILTAEALGFKASLGMVAKQYLADGTFSLINCVPFEKEALTLGRKCFIKFGPDKCNYELEIIINQYFSTGISLSTKRDLDVLNNQ